MAQLQDSQAPTLIKLTDPLIKRRMEHHTTMVFKALCHLIDESQVEKASYLAGAHIVEMKHIIGAESGGYELAKIMGLLVNDGKYADARAMVLAVCDLCDVSYPSHCALSTSL